MSLTISAIGKVKYNRKKGNVSTSLDAPLKEFTHDGFIVGVAFFTTKFIVTEAPNIINGKWLLMMFDSPDINKRR